MNKTFCVNVYSTDSNNVIQCHTVDVLANENAEWDLVMTVAIAEFERYQPNLNHFYAECGDFPPPNEYYDECQEWGNQ
jgi:hypothetical protein